MYISITKSIKVRLAIKYNIYIYYSMCNNITKYEKLIQRMLNK